MERKEILVADKITKIYGIGTKTLFEALHEVSLTMYEGEFVCIIPTKGKFFINGKEVRVMSEGEIGKFRYENLGFIFQEFNLLDSLTIFENIAVPLTLANVNKKEITQRVQEVAKELNEKEGVSILMVTHDSKIASYSSKLLYIKDGIIDRTIEREGLSQKEYFYKIVDINSSESQELFE